MISVLFVMKNSIYTRLNVDIWDIHRNAFNYTGPNKVITHPPCGPWGLMKSLCKLQDPKCGPFAVEQVQKYGGILEHPRYSKLFDYCKLPKPGDRLDQFGGFTIYVEQVSYGHCCIKPTWLYMVGVDKIPEIKTGGTPTHCITTYKNTHIPGTYKNTHLLRVSKYKKSATPLLFAEFLISCLN